MVKKNSAGRAPLFELALANFKELIRQPTTFFFVCIFPFMFLGIFYLIQFMMVEDSYTMGMYAVNPGSVMAQNVSGYMEAADGISYRPFSDESTARKQLEDGGIDVLILLSDGGDEPTQVMAKSENSSAGMIARQILIEAEHALRGSAIQTVGIDGRNLYDPIKSSIPAVLVTAFASLAFFGTATPIIQLRQKGTLRLLGTTPLPKLTFLGGQLLPRLGIALVQMAVMFFLAHRLGFLITDHLPQLVLSSFLGLMMFFSFGYLIGGLLNSPEVASGVLAPLLPLLLIFSGIFIPLELMPDSLARIAKYIPVTYLGDAIGQTMVGAEAVFPLTTSYLIMGGTAALLTLVTAITFRWDLGEAG